MCVIRSKSEKTESSDTMGNTKMAHVILEDRVEEPPECIIIIN